MNIVMVIIFIITGAYPLSMLLSILAISGGGPVNHIKGWSYVIMYWASLVILALPFVAIEYARA